MDRRERQELDRYLTRSDDEIDDLPDDVVEADYEDEPDDDEFFPDEPDADEFEDEDESEIFTDEDDDDSDD